MTEALSIIITGPPGAGKSWTAATAPGPRLAIDAEGGSRFTPVPKRRWNPLTEPVPEALGDNETVLVSVTDWHTADILHRFLLTGKHPFRSIIVDTLTELQARLIDHVAGADQIKIQGWGEVRRTLEDYVRKLRDLTINPINPIDAVIFITQDTVIDGKHVPMISGGIKNTLAQFVDVIGYLFAQGDERGLLVTPTNTYGVKDRTNVFVTKYKNEENGLAVIPNPNLLNMIVELNLALGGSFSTTEIATTEV